MSSTTGALDRSTLDGKDRAELQTIAQAMGGRPTSRMRKGDVVDMILDLAGVGPGDDPSAGVEVGRKSSASSDAEPSETPAEEASDRGDDPDARESAAEDDSSGDESNGDSNDDKRSDSDSDTDGGSNRGDRDNDSGRGRDRNRGGRDSGRSERGGRSERDGDKADSGRSERDGDKRDGGRGRNRDRNDRDRNDRNDRNKNDRNKNDRNRDGRGQNDNAEPGNRKRRRRGGGGGREENVPDWDGEPVPVEGYLDLRDEGFGFLRVGGGLPTKNDVYVPTKFIRGNGLRRGDFLKGNSRPANRNEKNPAMLELSEVNGGPLENAKKRPKFDDLTPLFPDEKLRLERPDDPTNMTARIIDLISPIGKGQRGLIVSPPKAGKTTIVKEIVRSIEINNPEAKVLVLLVDERPEEVTDMKRWLVRGEVIASTFDRPASEHTAVAEMAIERAKRMVEFGDDVVIVLDGITRLARAYNLAAPATGRIMSGGVDSGALYPPKRFFGAARNVEEGGSLTILATALVETGSRMDEVIFEEFKGTGNMELRLDRRTAERRIYPAIDVDASSTRHEELLFERTELNQVWKLRRVLTGMANDDDNSRGNAAGLELLIDRLKTFPTNGAFLQEVARGPVG